MYYSHKCSYCSKLFYTFDNNKGQAAKRLYEGIKQHLIDYDEDRKEHKFDEHPQIEARQMYSEMNESEDKPAGGYEV